MTWIIVRSFLVSPLSGLGVSPCEFPAIPLFEDVPFSPEGFGDIPGVGFGERFGEGLGETSGEGFGEVFGLSPLEKSGEYTPE